MSSGSEVAVRFDQSATSSLFAASKQSGSAMAAAILRADPARQAVQVHSSRLLLCAAALSNNDQFSLSTISSSSLASNPFAIANRTCLIGGSGFKNAIGTVKKGILWVFPPPPRPAHDQVPGHPLCPISVCALPAPIVLQTSILGPLLSGNFDHCITLPYFKVRTCSKDNLFTGIERLRIISILHSSALF
jgi:hypothetical protein